MIGENESLRQRKLESHERRIVGFFLPSHLINENDGENRVSRALLVLPLLFFYYHSRGRENDSVPAFSKNLWDVSSRDSGILYDGMRCCSSVRGIVDCPPFAFALLNHRCCSPTAYRRLSVEERASFGLREHVFFFPSRLEP